MFSLWPIERIAICEIFNEQFQDKLKVQSICDVLIADSRDLSSDVSNENACAGFYLTFADNRVLDENGWNFKSLAIHAHHDELTAGAEFLLFSNPSGGVDFLEATFYGQGIVVSRLASEDHGFRFESKEMGE